MHYVQADLLQLDITSNGFDHILVIEDRYTKYSCLFPMQGKDATTVAKHFGTYIQRFGCPTIWGSDNGGEFKNRLIEALCKVYNTRKEFSMVYNPRAQGQVERKNSTIIAELAKRIIQWGPQWSRYLGSLEFGYNTTPHSSDGFTPHLKMFGREARTPLQNALPQPTETKAWNKSMARYVQEHQKRLDKIHEVKDDLHKQYMEKMAALPKDKSFVEHFEVGDQVMRFLNRESHGKLAPNFEGPWTVKKRIDPPGGIGNAYVLQKGDEEIVRPRVDLKRFFPEAFPRPKEATETQKVVKDPQLNERDPINNMAILLSLMSLASTGPMAPGGPSDALPLAGVSMTHPDTDSDPDVVLESDDDVEDAGVAIPAIHTISPRSSDVEETNAIEADPPTTGRSEDAAHDPGPSTSQAATLPYIEGILEQSPPKAQDSSESDDEVFHEPSLQTPNVRRSRAVSGRSEPDTNHPTDTLSRVLTAPPNTPQSIRNTGTTGGTPYFDVHTTPGPLNSTPQRKVNTTSSIPKQATRRVFQTTSASTATPSAAKNPTRKPTQTEPTGGAIPKKTARELKMLATYNKRGKSEENAKTLPPKRQWKGKRFKLINLYSVNIHWLLNYMIQII